MELRNPKEYQTIRLFAILGVLTLVAVLLLKVVLFDQQSIEMNRVPAQTSPQTIEVPNSRTK